MRNVKSALFDGDQNAILCLCSDEEADSCTIHLPTLELTNLNVSVDASVTIPAYYHPAPVGRRGRPDDGHVVYERIILVSPKPAYVDGSPWRLHVPIARLVNGREIK